MTNDKISHWPAAITRISGPVRWADRPTARQARVVVLVANNHFGASRGSLRTSIPARFATYGTASRAIGATTASASTASAAAAAATRRWELSDPTDAGA